MNDVVPNNNGGSNLGSETPKKKVWPIIIGVIALLLVIVAIGVGYLFLSNSADKVYEKAIHKFANSIIKNIDENMPNEISFDNDLSITGKVNVDSSVDLQDLDLLKDYTYRFQLDLSVPKEIMKMDLGIIEDDNEFLTGKVIFQNGKGYGDVPDILPNMIELENAKADFSDMKSQLKDTSIDKNVYIELVKEIRDSLVSSIKKDQIHIEKNLTKTYHEKELKVDEYSYQLTKENQQEILDKIKEALKENQKIADFIQKISNISIDDFTKSLDSISFDDAENYTFNVTTTGPLHDVVAISLENSQSTLEVVDYNGQKSITMDDILIEIIEEKDSTSISFESETIDGSLIYQIKKESDSKLSGYFELELNTEEDTYNITFEGSIDTKANITEENVSNAKKQNDFTETDYLKIYNNFIAKIKGTSLEDLFYQYFGNNF